MVRKTIMLSEDLVRQIHILSKKDDRDFSSSLRHVLKIGILALQNPELSAEEIVDILQAKVDLEAGELSELSLEDL